MSKQKPVFYDERKGRWRRTRRDLDRLPASPEARQRLTRELLRGAALWRLGSEDRSLVETV